MGFGVPFYVPCGLNNIAEVECCRVAAGFVAEIMGYIRSWTVGWAGSAARGCSTVVGVGYSSEVSICGTH